MKFAFMNCLVPRPEANSLVSPSSVSIFPKKNADIFREKLGIIEVGDRDGDVLIEFGTERKQKRRC